MECKVQVPLVQYTVDNLIGFGQIYWLDSTFQALNKWGQVFRVSDLLYCWCKKNEDKNILLKQQYSGATLLGTISFWSVSVITLLIAHSIIKISFSPPHKVNII